MTTTAIPTSGGAVPSSFGGSGSQTPIPQRQQQQQGQAQQLPTEHNPDYQKIMQELEQQRAKNETLEQTLGKMRGAFVEESEDPNGWYDEILRIGQEAEKQGSGMPVTIDLATRLRQQIDKNQSIEKKLAALEQVISANLNPEALHDQRTFVDLDSYIADSVGKVYGDDAPQIVSILGRNVSREISELRQNNPQKWDALRRNPELQKEIVNRNMLSLIPKSLRDKMHYEDLKNTPMTINQLAEALAEAKRIKNPTLRAQTIAKIRQDALVKSVMNKKENSFQSRVRRYER